MSAAAPRSLRSRLIGTYVAVLFVALLLFAAVAIFAIDRTLRSTLDSRLATEAQACALFIDVKGGRIRIDSDDRRQFLAVLGVQSGGLVVDDAGRLLLSSVSNPPAQLQRSDALSGYFDIGSGDARVRAFATPIEHGGIRIGSIVVWRPSNWIGETDLGAAIAFVAAAALIAGIALLAGGAVTRRALDDAFARQRRFTADASHELRAPLAVIRAEADLALRKERDPAIYRAAIETIASESDRMEMLIGDLLSAARAEAGHLKRGAVDIATIARRVCERLESTAAAKEADLDVDANVEACVAGDPDALERALLAVVHNAVKYAPEKSRVEVRVDHDAGSVEVTVRDSGPGFSSQALEHAHERFWREDSARRPDGTGLGLAIAKSIVEAFHGTLTLSNAASGGANVRMRFPAA